LSGKINGARAVIAMSGGIDSSVAAFLMKEQGHDCTGITMRLSGCSSQGDIDDARKVSEFLGMTYYVCDFQKDFENEVIDRFIKSYIDGATPNPCIFCNRFIKLKKLLLHAVESNYDYIATGHYAKIEYDDISKRYLLKKAADEKKDQSYVLYLLTQEQLKHIKFPLGNLTKTEAREIAEKNGFINPEKKESQDICFVPDGDYAGFIERHTGKIFPDGDFIDTEGNILGRHKGIIRYTKGQRKGLGLALKEPMYVFDKSAGTNTVTLCRNDELFAKELTAHDINLIPFDKIDGRIKIKAKVRYNQSEQPAVAEQTDKDTLHIEFETPQRAITKGQAVVLYDGDTVIGGGTIS